MVNFDGEICNASDQLDGYMEEIYRYIRDLTEKYHVSFENALKIAEIAVQDQKNEIAWSRQKQFIEVIQDSVWDLIRFFEDFKED